MRILKKINSKLFKFPTKSYNALVIIMPRIMPYLVKRKELMLMLLISVDTQCKPVKFAYSPPNSTL